MRILLLALTLDPAAPASDPPPPPSSSVRMTLEATQVDRPAVAPTPAPRSPKDEKLLHGFRLGYGYVLNYDKPAAGLDGESLKQRADLRAPSHLLVGYEVMYRVVGHSWLNVLLLASTTRSSLASARTCRR